MSQNSRKKCLAVCAQFTVFTGKHISAVLKKPHVQMQTGTIYILPWFRHKCGMKTVTLCNRTDCHFKCHHLICSGKRIFKCKVNLMLRRCDLMMRRCNLISHLLQRQNNLPSCILTQIDRRRIQISCSFVRNSRRNSIVICMEQEKFTLRIHFQCIALFLCFFQRPFQDQTRAQFIFSAILCTYITQKTGNFSILRTPWQYGKRRKIRLEIQLCLLFFCKSVQRSQVDRAAGIHCFFQAADRNCDIFQGSEHICKLQTDKLNAFFLHNLQNFCFSILLHNILSLSYTMILLYFSLTDLYTPSENNPLLLQPVFLPGSPIRPVTDLCAYLPQ